ASGEHQSIVHAGRQEWLFCWHAVGAPPARLFDVQVAAGLAGGEFPSSYAALINKWLGQHAKKGETRTDWRRRPLATRQLDYDVDDVRHLLPLRDVLVERLESLGRGAWLAEEMATWQATVNASLGDDQWRRVSGTSSLPRREEPGAKRIVLGQFLAAALAALCRETDISPGLLGGPGDVRDLIAWRLGERDEGETPALAVGWRAEVIGRRLDELLEGKL